ncbi:MAG: CoA ester lyase [Sideroxydans sp.]|nr:CoA ester lyase [Sideroxydans sp.]
MLYVPGCNTRFLEKARTLPADSLILDLGDPILIAAKEASRQNVVDAIKHGGYGERELVVRVNDLASPWGHDDIKAVAKLNIDAVLFTNIESRKNVLDAIAALDQAGGQDVPVMVMIESPLAVLHAEEIASASDRIACMIVATSDLISQMHAHFTKDRFPLLTSLSMVILAARAYNRGVVDGINSHLKNMEAFEYACRLGRDLGFDGKSLVHPLQLAYANDAYTPKQVEVLTAREIITALSEANAAGRGTVVVNDRLVEHHHIKSAQRLLNMSEMIQKLEASYA